MVIIGLSCLALARVCMEAPHSSYTMCTYGLPDVYTLNPRACGPQALGAYISQTAHAHGIKLLNKKLYKSCTVPHAPDVTDM